MGWDRHKLLWDRRDKDIPWTTLTIIWQERTHNVPGSWAHVDEIKANF